MEVTRTAIRLFGLEIHWYGVLIVAGIGLGVWLAWKREERMGLPRETVLDLALVCVPLALVGARAYYVVFSLDEFIGRPWWKVFAVWEGGMAIYGGLIAGVLGGWLYARAKKLSFWKLADLVAPSIALGQAIGRWGNFVNQEAHGALVENPALQFFPVSVSIGGEWYYATFFYESMWCLLIVAALLWAERRNRFLRRGDEFLAYAFLYALERAVVEGMRTDSLYWGAMRVSQGLSLLAAAVVAGIWAVRARRAPMALRIASPGCVVVAIAFAAWGNMWGVFAAAVAALAVTVWMYAGELDRQMNRGEVQ